MAPSPLLLYAGVHRFELPQHGGVVIGRDIALAADQGIEVGIGQFDQPLEIVQRRLVQRADMGIGKAADDQIGLAHAAAPGAEQKLLAPLIQALARSFRHGGSEKTPKARTRPGEGYIENGAQNVSGLSVGVEFVRCGRTFSTRFSQPSRRYPASGRSWRSCLRGFWGARANHRASSICCFTCRPDSSTGATNRS